MVTKATGSRRKKTKKNPRRTYTTRSIDLVATIDMRRKLHSTFERLEKATTAAIRISESRDSVPSKKVKALEVPLRQCEDWVRSLSYEG